MSIINNNFNPVSTLLGSMSSNGSTDMLLSDYASLKNGSYGKLLKAYYKETGANASSKSSGSSASDTKADEKATNVKKAASSLAEATDHLSDPSLFTKKTLVKKDENGNEIQVEDYDRDAIYDAVSAFVKSYNSAIDTIADDGTDRVLRLTLNMQNATEKNEKLLSKVGITIGKDNTLSVDKEILEKADINTLQTLFTGGGSYASTVRSKASFIYSTASSNASTKSSYTASGNYLDKIMDNTIYNKQV